MAEGTAPTRLRSPRSLPQLWPRPLPCYATLLLIMTGSNRLYCADWFGRTSGQASGRTSGRTSGWTFGQTSSRSSGRTVVGGARVVSGAEKKSI